MCLDREEEARMLAHVAHRLMILGMGFCIHCLATIEREEKVGRSVYARPCGHRLFQGEPYGMRLQKRLPRGREE